MMDLSILIAVGLFVAFVAVVALWMQMRWKEQADKRFTDLQKVAQDIYKLSNSHMEAQLRLNAGVTKRLAEMTGEEGDKNTAEESKLKYVEHVKRQQEIDHGEGSLLAKAKEAVAS